MILDFLVNQTTYRFFPLNSMIIMARVDSIEEMFSRLCPKLAYKLPWLLLILVASLKNDLSSLFRRFCNWIKGCIKTSDSLNKLSVPFKLRYAMLRFI